MLSSGEARRALATLTLVALWCAQAYPSDILPPAKTPIEPAVKQSAISYIDPPSVDVQHPEMMAAVRDAAASADPSSCVAEGLTHKPYAQVEHEMSADAEALSARQRELELLLDRLRTRAATEPPEARPSAGPHHYYFASNEEIDAVAAVFEDEHVSMTRSQIVSASKHWRTGSSPRIRALELTTLTLIIAGATIGAIKEVVTYIYHHYMDGTELTCVGVVRAAYTGAALGAAFGALQGVKAIFWLKYIADAHDYAEALTDTIHIIAPILEAVFGWPRNDDLFVQTLTTIADFVDLVFNKISDMVWADSPVRAPAVIFCSAATSQSLRHGDFKGWIHDDLMPAFEDEYGFQFADFQEQVDTASRNLNTTPESTPSVLGDLELIRADGADTAQLTTNEPLTWRVRMQPNRPGTYVVNLKVSRNGNDYGTVVQANATADYAYQSLTVEGSVSSATIFSKAGSVQGNHQLKVEIINVSQSWTQFLQQPDDTDTVVDVEIRANRKPSVSLLCATLLGLTKCDVFVMDPDNTRPQSLYLTVDGADQNLTSNLPASGVDWTAGYTVMQNLSLTQGVHTVRARASDASATSYSGPAKTLRVGSLPYVLFPGVTLTNVGVKQRYGVGFVDSIGGISGADVYVHSNRLGHLASTDGAASFKFVTGDDGWTYFDYTPMETGQHTLSVTVMWGRGDCQTQCTYELQQTSNDVGPPAASVPSAPSNVQAYAVSSTTVDVHWTDTSTVENGFEIERKSGSGGTWGVVGYGGRDATSFTNIGVSANTDYYYRVRAQNSSGYSAYSNEAAATTCVPPDDFRIDDPYNGETSVPVTTTLNWYTVAHASSYDVYFGTTNPPPLYTSVSADPSFPSTQSINLTNLQAGQTFYWQVKAHATCDGSKVSSTAVSQFATIGAPGSVTLIKPANNATGVPTGTVFSWQAVTTPGTTVYDLYLGTTNPPPFFATSSWETQMLVTTLSANTTYYWQIVAKAAKDPSLTSSSAIWTLTTGSSSSTTVDLNVIKDAGLRGGNFGGINYAGANTSDPAQNGFYLGNDWGCAFSYSDAAAPLRAALQFDLSSIPAGSNITNATLKLPYSGSCTQSTPTSPPPIYIDPFVASWSESSITYNNKPNVDTNNRVSTTVPISHGSPLSLDITTLAQRWFSGATTNYGAMITMPTWETMHGYVKMFKQREAATTPAVLSITYAVPCAAPAAPATPSPANGATNQLSTVNLTWASVTGSANYNVYFGEAASPSFYKLVTTNAAQVTALKANTVYYWRVESLADCDPTKVTSSATWSFTTGSCVASPPPALTAPADGALSQPKSITLSWPASSWAASYEVLIGTTNPPSTSLASVTGTTYQFSAAAATQYFWMVRGIASCDANLKADSPVYSFHTAAAPTADAGAARTINAGESTQLGGSPAAAGGTSPYTYTWSIVSKVGGSLSASNIANPTFNSGVAGEVRCELVVTDAKGFSAPPAQVAITVNATSLATPSNVRATTQTPNVVGLAWDAVPGALSYEIARGPRLEQVAAIASVQTTGFSDMAVTSSGVYVYRVRAVGASGTSAWSVPHLTTAVVLTDDPLVVRQTSIRASHILELRAAINAIRAAAGLGAFTFTDAISTGVPVKAIHFSELRSALDPARTVLGVGAMSYSRSITAQSVITALDLTEIRNAVR